MRGERITLGEKSHTTPCLKLTASVVFEIWIFTLKRGMLIPSSGVFRVAWEEATEEDGKQPWSAWPQSVRSSKGASSTVATKGVKSGAPKRLLIGVS